MALKSYRHLAARMRMLPEYYSRPGSTPLNLMNPKHPKASIRIRLIAAGTCLAFFAGCAQIATVSEKRPAALPPGSGANQVATQTIDSALAEEKKQPIVALGGFIAAARDSLRQLDRNPSNVEARRAYNFAVARIFTVVRDAKLDPWTQPMRVGAKGEFTLTWKRDPRPEWNLALYDLVPADELDFKGTYVKDHVKKDGIGAPLVAERTLTAQQASALFCAPHIFYSVTATAQFEGSRCVVSINDPLATENVHVDGHNYPLRKPMVVVAHSMGGSITHTLLTDAGTTLWVEAFGHPPAQTPMDPQSKRQIEEVLIFNHRRDIGRVVFMSTPHRGSDLASNWIGRIGSMLVRTPSRMLTIGRTLRETLTADPAALKLKRLPNSVDTLAPNNRFVVAINKIPMTKTIPYHSIIGDRGRGDSPNSSDGVVAYWSSHLDGARSERIVPSGHGSPLNPEAIAEVHRILQLNAKSHRTQPQQPSSQDTHHRAGVAVDGDASSGAAESERRKP